MRRTHVQFQHQQVRGVDDEKDMKMDLIVGRKDMIRKKIGNQQDFMDLNFVYDMAVQQFKYNDNHEWVTLKSPKPTFEQVVDTVIGQINHVMERIRAMDLDNIDNVYRIYKNVLSKYRRYNKFISSTDREPQPFETFIEQVVHQHQQNRQKIVLQKIQKIGEQHGLDPAFVHQMAVTVMRYVSPKPTFENAVDIVLGQIRRIIEILDDRHQQKTKTKDNVYRMYTKILAKYFRERTKKQLDTPPFDTFINTELERL